MALPSDNVDKATVNAHNVPAGVCYGASQFWLVATVHSGNASLLSISPAIVA